jgi:hypothetical protein
LFVPAQDVAQPLVVLPQGVIERHDGPAGNAEDDFDSLADQGFTHDLGAGAGFWHGWYLNQIQNTNVDK